MNSFYYLQIVWFPRTSSFVSVFDGTVVKRWIDKLNTIIFFNVYLFIVQYIDPLHFNLSQVILYESQSDI